MLLSFLVYKQGITEEVGRLPTRLVEACTGADALLGTCWRDRYVTQPDREGTAEASFSQQSKQRRTADDAVGRFQKALIGCDESGSIEFQ